MFRKRWVRRVLKSIPVILGLALASYLVDRYWTRRAGEKRLAAIVQRLDETDPRWRYEEIEADRGNMPDRENSALLVPKFREALAKPRFDKDQRLSDLYVNAVPNHVLEGERYDAIDSAISSNPQALFIAISFRDYPKGLRHYVLPPVVINVDFLDVNELRAIVFLLDLASERYGRDGRGGVALAHVLPMLNAGRSADGEPHYISALVRMACDAVIVRRVERTLALAQPKDFLIPVQQILLDEADKDLFWYSVRGERAVLDRLFHKMDAGIISIDDLSSSNPSASSDGIVSSMTNWGYKAHLASDRALSLELMTQVYDARRMIEHQQRAELKRLDRAYHDLPHADLDCLLTRTMTPAFTKIHDASLRAKANLRCAATGIAVERFRLASGRWPDSLEELPRNLLPAIPLDPFDGKPLKFVQRADGVTIYSVGLDEQDDGGAIPIGKTTNEPGQDVGFRLYNPDQRGLPSLPRSSMPGNVAIGPNGEEILADDDVPEIGPQPREVGIR